MTVMSPNDREGVADGHVTRLPADGLTEIEVTPDQARFLVDLNQQARAAAEAAKQRFVLAASAVLAGRVPEGAEVKQIDLVRSVVIVKTE